EEGDELSALESVRRALVIGLAHGLDLGVLHVEAVHGNECSAAGADGVEHGDKLGGDGGFASAGTARNADGDAGAFGGAFHFEDMRYEPGKGFLRRDNNGFGHVSAPG